MTLIGYARVSTEDQTTAPQAEALRAAGCTVIREEQASGAKRARPVLNKLLKEIKAGETLVVVRIDRLARSLSHLLEVIEGLEARGAHFRSLGDPIDTASPQGKFTLQILGATAEFERSLIRERTMAGLASARAQGRTGGNPALRARDPQAIKALSAARQDHYMQSLIDSAADWVPVVKANRPALTWDQVTTLVNRGLPDGKPHWSKERLMRAARFFVRDNLLPKEVLGRAKPSLNADRIGGLDPVFVLAGLKTRSPKMTLKDLAASLEGMHIKTPRGSHTWSTSTVAHMLLVAKQRGLLG
jgi:DNA invertase Pin-like site-specific DNA recombinase